MTLELGCFFRFLRAPNSYSQRTQNLQTVAICSVKMWCFRLHSWFFIRSQDQHFTNQFSFLLSWLKLAKQVQICRASHAHKKKNTKKGPPWGGGARGVPICWDPKSYTEFSLSIKMAPVAEASINQFINTIILKFQLKEYIHS